MLYPSDGTLVPKLLDSSENPPNFKFNKKEKPQVIAVTVFYLAPDKWKCWFTRYGKNSTRYSPSSKSIMMLVRLIRELNLLDFVDVSPDPTGWTAYVDTAVYPPPKVRNDEPEEHTFDEAQERIFAAFEELASRPGPRILTTKCGCKLEYGAWISATCEHDRVWFLNDQDKLEEVQ